jgi:hypothetical protein
MVTSWWLVALAFLIGGAVGGLIPLVMIFTGWSSLLCKRSILCITAKGHEEPQQIHLSWCDTPDQSLAVTWVTRSKNNSNTIQYRPAGQSAWLESSGRAIAVPRRGLAPAVGVLHQGCLQGLTADSIYEYRVSSDLDASRPWSQIRSARTAPQAGVFTAAFIADTGQTGRIDGLADGVTEVLRAVRAENPLLILGGGDYAYADRDGRFTDPNLAIDNWFRMMEPLISEIPFMAQYGNHELRLTERLRLWKRRFAHPPGFNNGDCYSFDLAGAHFTSILADGENDLGPDLITWLDQDLSAARARGTNWLIVFQHESIYGSGHSHPNRSEAQTVLAPIFLRHKVDLHLSAHDQNLERTFPLIGDPEKPEIASADLSNYRKGAGVIYAKVSPSGKRSEIGHGFSKLPDEKADYVAVRDDTAHHYAVISVDHGVLEVRVVAVHPDGGPTQTIDQFRIQA